MSYTFAGSLFDRRSDAIAVVAETFISADGWNSVADIRAWLADPAFPRQCAREMLSDWDCNIATGEEPDYPTEDELAEAISALKAEDFE